MIKIQERNHDFVEFGSEIMTITDNNIATATRWNSFLQLGFFPAANDRCLWVSSEWDRSCLAAVYEMVMNCQRATVFHSTKATIDHTSTFGRQYNSKPLKTIHHCTKLQRYNKTTVHHSNPKELSSNFHNSALNIFVPLHCFTKICFSEHYMLLYTKKYIHWCTTTLKVSSSSKCPR